jgi:23S rRNA (cytosine1962-C5)-methyltransferase
VRLSYLALARALAAALAGLDGAIETGEMALPEDGGGLLPTAIYARWLRNPR